MAATSTAKSEAGQPWLYGFLMCGLLAFAVLGPWFIAETESRYVIITSAITVISYSQEIGIFGRYYLHWDDSPRMRAMLKWAFLFQLNPEILAMECTQRVDFVVRWRSLMLLPLVLVVIAICAVGFYFVAVGGQVRVAPFTKSNDCLPIVQSNYVGNTHGPKD